MELLNFLITVATIVIGTIAVGCGIAVSISFVVILCNVVEAINAKIDNQLKDKF